MDCWHAPAVKVDTIRETGFTITTTNNTTAGPGGIVRIQTVDTIEFFGNDLLTSTSFTPMKQYPGTPPDNNCPSPCSSKDKYPEKEIQTEGKQEAMETSRTDLLASCKPTSVSKSTNTKPISPTKNTNIQRPFKKRVHFKKQCNIDDEEFIDSLNNIL